MDKDEIHLRRLPAAAPWGPRKCAAGRGVRGALRWGSGVRVVLFCGVPSGVTDPGVISAK